MTSYKRQELISEYESTYLAYVKGTDYLTFAEWLVKYKGYAPRKPKDTRRYMCNNCGGVFKHSEMVFDDDNENDLCKDCAK